MHTLSIKQDLPSVATQPDFVAVKTRQRAAWSSGDYAVVGTTLQIVGEALCEAMDLRSVSACSTWLPATATSRSLLHAAGAK